MTWFRPLLSKQMLYPMIRSGYYDIEFTPELIYLLVEGRLKRAYERNVL